MIDRRTFLQVAAGLPLALVGETEGASWPTERDDFHPFAPERVITLNRCDLGSPHWIREKLSRKIPHLANMSIGKFDLLITVVKILTDYYGVPQFFEAWASRLVQQEQLGNRQIATIVSPPVDWWLFLVPEGVDHDGQDSEPVFVMIGS